MIRIHYVPPTPTTPLVDPQGLEYGPAQSGVAKPIWTGEQVSFPKGKRSQLSVSAVGTRGRTQRNERDALQLSQEWQDLSGKAGRHEAMFRMLHDATCRLDAEGKPNLDALRESRKRLRQWFHAQRGTENKLGSLKGQVAKVDAALSRLVRRNVAPGEAEDERERAPSREKKAPSLTERVLSWVNPNIRDARSHHKDALKLWTAGKTTEALNLIEAAADKAPHDWRIQHDLGRMLADDGYHAEAEWALITAVGLKPQAADLHMALGELYAQQGLQAMAVESFRAATVREPNLTDAHAQLGVALYEDGRPAEAAPHLQRAVSLDSQCVVGRFYLAQVMLQQNDLLRARFQLGMVAQMSPDMDLARFGASEPHALMAQAGRREGTVYHWKLPDRPKPD